MSDCRHRWISIDGSISKTCQKCGEPWTPKPVSPPFAVPDADGQHSGYIVQPLPAYEPPSISDEVYDESRYTPEARKIIEEWAARNESPSIDISKVKWERTGPGEVTNTTPIVVSTGATSPTDPQQGDVWVAPMTEQPLVIGLTDDELRTFAFEVQANHTPSNQEDNGYERCALCHYTRHPCEVHDLATAVLQLLDRDEH